MKAAQDGCSFMRANSQLIFRLLLAVEAVHGCRGSVSQNHLHSFCSFVQYLVHCLELRLLERPQYVSHTVLNLAIRRDAQPDSQELLCTQRPNQRLHPVVTRRAATLPDTNRPQRQVQLVIDHNQISYRVQLVLRKQRAYREATQVHVGLRLGQKNLFCSDRGPCCKRPALAIPDLDPAIVRDTIDSEKTQIVRRELVFDSGIAQPDDQFHTLSTSRVLIAKLRSTPSDLVTDTAARPRPHRDPYFFSFFSVFAAFSAPP